MDLCFAVVPNHWLDIVLFTFITKILQLPISLWCHRNSLTMVSLMPETNRLKVKYFGDNERIGEESAALFKRKHYHPLLSLVPLSVQVIILMGFVKVIYRIARENPGSAIALVPATDGGIAWLMPIVAGFAAFILGLCQNHINPLQHEQSRAQQITTNGISIAISLSLGCFVGMGVGLYWAFSNLFSILVQLACNAILRPSKYIDYPALRSSQKELVRLQELGRTSVSKEDKHRERVDYRKFFRVANKHVVFYSESSGFYKYFKNTIAYLLSRSNLIVHYITNDPKDQIFEIAKREPRIRPYYIGPVKIIPLFMKMDADMVIMTTPDLDRFQLKRSYVRKDVEYCYQPHGVCSMTMVTREHAYDSYDTFFGTGPHQFEEIRAMEKYYGTPEKRLVPCGYGLLDDLVESVKAMHKPADAQKTILIAPSYQADNILDSCLDELLEALVGKGFRIIVRPHPQYKKRYPARLEALVEKWSSRLNESFLFETDFSSNVSTFTADVLVTDWSTIAHEFAFSTLRPVLFIDTPMKIVNPNYKAYGLPVTDIEWRSRLGISLKPEDAGSALEAVRQLLAEGASQAQRLREFRDRVVFSVGHFGENSGRYILSRLLERSKHSTNIQPEKQGDNP